ncbi:ankyrin repeat domain-containing protein 9 [Latimeria chalumnae]|uniref:Ankyrin repeat domain 9 n=1 Tax=Latimeria chalumnae TaxID=7897 RepID=H3AF07_LATCH|nr:PREDICTED: ankyrin repeat domain-containing protein 9 [Latimeria chalumnae]|eukprot:XP_006010489.1 PREDICTED: ankyrin repeat domain-containing protein 9 [Latimeria chalumnae]
MPWDARHVDEYNNRDYQSQKQCKNSSFAFYQAIRDLLPVWILEDMRTMEVFHWEEGKVSTYSPSEALLYALVHDHQPYAQYLLGKFSKTALAMPSKNFSCCQSSAPHLTMAVRYNRVHILKIILKALKELNAGDRTRYINRRGCVHVESGKTPLHFACESVRPECLALLLGYGASPYVTDCTGNTPLDLLLQEIQQSGVDMRSKRFCLDSLLLFMPELKFKMKKQLAENEALWRNLLEEKTFRWLSGLSPPSLFTRAMQVVVQTVSPEQFPEGLEELQMPPFLKPLDFKPKN